MFRKGKAKKRKERKIKERKGKERKTGERNRIKVLTFSGPDIFSQEAKKAHSEL